MPEASLKPFERQFTPFNEFLAALFQALEREGVLACVLRNYEAFPFENVGGDIDLLVSPSQLACAVRAIRSVDGVRTVGFTEPTYAGKCMFLEGISQTPRTRAIQIDLIFRLGWKGLPYLDVDSVLKSAILRQAGGLNFFVPSPLHESIISLFSSLLVSGYLKEKYWPQVRQTFTSREAEVISELTPQFGPEPATQMVKAVVSGDYQRIMDSRKLVCRSLAIRSLLRRPLRSADSVVRHFTRALISRFTPRNLETVCILDPDGSYNAEIIERLMAILPSVAKTAKEFDFLPSHYGAAACRQTAIMAASQRSVATVSYISLWRIARFVVRDWVCQFRVKRDIKLRVAGITYDDLPIKSANPNHTVPMWFAQLVAKLAPPADLWIYLNPGADALQSRNSELSATESVQRLEVFGRFANMTRRKHVTVEAGKPLADVTEDVYTAIIAMLAERTEKLLGKAFPA